ncbi:UDP-3-O-acyl-N-acetylglucosamine deacetylase [Rubellimicrobium roseum]|uniref:UDP-3-O-acyl-N-acetylglucosamine deacetylase n=1 Tax=Rubellimicrobium roseum TaxID=687525 RepID=A0A5C4NN60_9RHOB|nr:UDP-3-O-acyl-N-acetylglucosamine deacetylase [Rubellimicrobium roseum]TNC73819.1 UDP-3-O-acyl-N-acetylglucosamine deacetylase [Rubellimicrobium roseum]
MQTTLLQPIAVSGVGLHSGATVRVTLRDAAPGTGIRFRRVDRPEPGAVLPALWDRVEVSPLNTRLSDGQGLSVSTIEHLMAAFAGTGLHNVVVEIDGPEVPILDGSSAPWMRAILDAGLRRLDAPLRVLEVLEPVEVREGPALARLEPSAVPAMSFAIDFPDAAIGRQALDLELSGPAVLRELCDSRTFCRESDVEAMRARGLALGGTYLNAVVVDGARVLSPGGLRHPDEAVRHKMLDAVGDLATAGGPVLGRYVGVRSGHAMTNRLLRALFARPSAWRWIEADPALAARLPGAGVDALGMADLPAVA